MSERLINLLEESKPDNTMQAVIVKLQDGTEPFLFMRNPVSQNWGVQRKCESDIYSHLVSSGFAYGTVAGEDWAQKGRESDIRNPEISVKIVEIESEKEFEDTVLAIAKEAADGSDYFSQEAWYYARLKHLLYGDTE